MKYGIFKLDGFGYAHFACPDLFACAADANTVADQEYPDAHVWPYHEYLRRRDPDDAPQGRTRAVVVTGVIEGMTRRQVAARLRGMGYAVAPKVSASTAALIIGRDPGMSKVKAARQHGIPIKTWSMMT